MYNCTCGLFARARRARPVAGVCCFTPPRSDILLSCYRHIIPHICAVVKPFSARPSGGPALGDGGGGRRPASVASRACLCCAARLAARRPPLARSPARRSRRCAPSGARVDSVRAVRRRRGALGAPAEVCPVAYAARGARRTPLRLRRSAGAFLRLTPLARIFVYSPLSRGHPL